MSQAACRSIGRSEVTQSYTLPPEARDKLVQIALLVGDVIEAVMRARGGADGSQATPTEPRRRGSRTPYVPPQEPSDIDRAKARRLLASRGLVEIGR